MSKNVPSLRFKDFHGEWEEKKLADFITRISKGSKKSELPCLEYEDVISGLGQLNKDISAKGTHKKGIEFEAGDTLFGKLRPYLQNWLLPDFDGIAVGDWWVLRPNAIDSSFLYSFIQATQYQTAANISTGTKMPRSDWNVVSNMAYSIPFDTTEQARIGSLFRNLDSLIMLEQQKHDKLKNLKKAMLEKMFPKSGATVPEVRFKGFSGEWEEKKLGEIGNVAMNRRIFKDETSECGEIPFYKIGTFGGVPDAFISRELFEQYKSKYPYPTCGDLLISASGSIGRIIEYTGKDEYFQDSNIVWLQHDDQIVNSFLKQFYLFVKWSGLEGSTIKRLYNKNILETLILLPGKKEQTRIGSFFRLLDSLISLQQRKCAKLHTLKKALLGKLFL